MWSICIEYTWDVLHFSCFDARIEVRRWSPSMKRLVSVLVITNPHPAQVGNGWRSALVLHVFESSLFFSFALVLNNGLFSFLFIVFDLESECLFSLNQSNECERIWAIRKFSFVQRSWKYSKVYSRLMSHEEDIQSSTRRDGHLVSSREDHWCE
jgi:hypothetical protein